MIDSCSKTPKKLYIQTFGCQMNEYDSSAMANVLRKSHEMELTKDPEEADVLLVNTCAIRHKAEEKFFSELGMWREYKAQRPEIVIGVGGCVASQEGGAIRRRAPYVDMIFGPQTLHRLPEMLNEVLAKRRPVVDISFPEIEKFDKLPEPRAEGIKAFVSIMEGCSKYCSYCVVPFTRGEEISRPFDDVIAEIVSLAEQGVREITLLGQNVNDYRGPMHNGEIADLALLIHYVAAIDSIIRIRFSTSHPLAFSDRLIEAFATEPKLANQLHLPVQSGSNRILSLMKRGYTVEEFTAKIERLRKVRPDISITSDFIVGFPGETEDDFAATMKLIAEVNFDNSYSFIYSKRPGTPAAALADSITLEIKKQRLSIMQQRLRQQMDSLSQAMLETSQLVLVEGMSKHNGDEIMGRTENNRTVTFRGGKNTIGQIVPVNITQTTTYLLKGEIIN
jgi:tRNA-2-methylthio-N6-dimethylallyladenosine synthase